VIVTLGRDSIGERTRERKEGRKEGRKRKRRRRRGRKEEDGREGRKRRSRRDLIARYGFSSVMEPYFIEQKRRKRHSMQFVSQCPTPIFIGRPVALTSIPLSRSGEWKRFNQL
jgi:hypothetical protein